MAKKTNGYTEGRVRQNISLNTQQTNFGLRAVKRYENTESRPGCKEDSWEATDGDAEGCNQKGTQHTTDRLRLRATKIDNNAKGHAEET